MAASVAANNANEWLAMSSLTGFLSVFARVGSALALVPLPGMHAVLGPVRVVLTLAIALILAPVWPRVTPPADAGSLAALLLGEVSIGLLLGMVASVAIECLVFSAQVLSLQAGYSYAVTVDPASEADSGILLVLAQLAASMLFFACGLDRPLLRGLARSLDAWPPGMTWQAAPLVSQVVKLGSMVLEFGLRLAMPIVALLLLTDLTLALLARLNAQLPLLHVSFSVKMLAALFLLAWLAPGWPALLKSVAEASWHALAGPLAAKAGG